MSPAPIRMPSSAKSSPRQRQRRDEPRPRDVRLIDHGQLVGEQLRDDVPPGRQQHREHEPEDGTDLGQTTRGGAGVVAVARTEQPADQLLGRDRDAVHDEREERPQLQRDLVRGHVRGAHPRRDGGGRQVGHRERRGADAQVAARRQLRAASSASRGPTRRARGAARGGTARPRSPGRRRWRSPTPRARARAGTRAAGRARRTARWRRAGTPAGGARPGRRASSPARRTR